MLLHHFLEHGAAARPTATVLIAGNRTVTYDELDRLANRFANALMQAGIQRHDRVVIALENSIELVATYLGTMKAGAVAVPLPAGPTSDRLPFAVAECGPAAAVIDRATAAELDAHPPPRPIRVTFVTGRRGPNRPPSGPVALEDVLAAGNDCAPNVRVIDIDLAAIIYTSGSTGEPRGVMLTHRNFVANARSIVSYLGLTERDRVMCVLPFYYVYGLSLLHTHLAVGGSLVLDNSFVYPNVVLRSMQKHAVTGFAGVPSTFALLLHRSALASTPLPTLRYVTQAGGAMPPARIREWLERGPKAAFYVMYGATEASARLTYLEPSRLLDKLGSIGKPIPDVEIVIVKDDGTLAKPGEVGELVACGSNIALGYWNAPEHTSERFSARGYCTGDLGYADDEGYLFLVGRKHDMIKVGAHRVGAKEIEDVLHDFPNVLEAAVVAAPHNLLGEAPVAFVSLRDSTSRDDLAVLAFCQTRLPAHKVPTRIVVRDELPKLGRVGKVDKRALLALVPADVSTVG